jgi:4-amino-4-deoxy-L-arabinose transferase-like glycosyltransferase
VSASRRERWILAAILLGALLVRVVYVLQSRANPFFAEPAMDAGYHLEWARALAAGHAFQPGPFFRAPLYPWFLALCLRVFGEDLLAVRLVQALIGTGSCWLAWRVGVRAFDARTGLIAAAIGAVYWMLVYFDAELLLPVLEVPTTLLVALAGLRWRERPGSSRALQLGLALGAAAIVRPNILLFAPLLGLWLVYESKTRLRTLLLAGLGLALPIAPITLYNGLVGGDWTLISTQGGVNLWIGNNPQADGASALVPGTRADWWGGYQDAIQQAEAREGRALKPSEVSDSYVRRVREFWASEPRHAFELTLWKLRLFLTDRELGNNQDERFFALHFGPVLRWLPFGFGLLLPLALLGLVLSARRARELFPLYALVPVYAASVVLFFVNARFRMPLVLPLAIFAAHALAWGLDALRARRFAPLGAALLLASSFWAFVQHVPAGVRIDDAQGWWQLGVHYAQHGDPARALQNFDMALERDPRLARLHRDRGLALAQLGRVDEAEAELRRALELQRDDPASYDELFGFLTDPARARFAEALDVARGCVLALPLYGKGYYGLGRAHFEIYRQTRGDADPTAQDLPGLRSAREAFTRALALPAQPQDRFNAAYGLGEVERLLGSPRAALDAWRTALGARSTPDSAGWYWRCAERFLTLCVQELGAPAARAELEALERRLGPGPELAALAQRLRLR